VSSEDALRRAVAAARSVSYSTGPSGVYLAKLFERWGLGDSLKEKIVQAPPGVPVGTLVARGDVELGLPATERAHASRRHRRRRRAARGRADRHDVFRRSLRGLIEPEAARELLAFMASPAAEAAKRAHGMEPA
jgi:molybdate transport system substrate-binding protein